MTIKLTQKQRNALDHIHDGDIEYHRFGYGAWRITGPVAPTVVGRVISMGLATWQDAPNSSDARIAVLTSEGRLARKQ